MSASRPIKRKPLLQNITGSVLAQIGVVSLTVAIISIRGRSLGPQGFGILSLTFILPNVIHSMLNLGIASSNIYHVARGEVSVRQALRATRQIWLVLSAIGCPIGAIVIAWRGESLFPGVPLPYLWIALSAYPVLLLNTYNRSLLLGTENFAAVNRIDLFEVTSMLFLTAGIAVAFSGSVLGLLIAYLTANLLVLAISSVVVGKSGRIAVEKNAKGYVLRSLRYGWKANLVVFLRFLNFRLDVLLIAYYLGSASAGLYAAALVIAEKLCLLPQCACRAISPRLASMHHDGEARDRLTCLVLRVSLLFGLISAALLAAVSQPLLTVCFGLAYKPAVIVLLWLLPGIVLEVFVLTITSNFAARGRVDLNLYRSALLVIINSVANIVLIPRVGVVGAALASTISYSILAVMTLRVFTSLAGTSLWAPFVPGEEDRQLAWRGVRLVRSWVGMNPAPAQLHTARTARTEAAPIADGRDVPAIASVTSDRHAA